MIYKNRENLFGGIFLWLKQNHTILTQGFKNEVLDGVRFCFCALKVVVLET